MADDSMDDKDDSSEKFPAFEGTDLDGNPVTSELFKENSVTVVNFWFSTCAPCIAELGELNALNEELKLKGGAVIGINADTIGGDESMITEAQEHSGKEGRHVSEHLLPCGERSRKADLQHYGVPHHGGGGSQRPDRSASRFWAASTMKLR